MANFKDLPVVQNWSQFRQLNTNDTVKKSFIKVEEVWKQKYIKKWGSGLLQTYMGDEDDSKTDSLLLFTYEGWTIHCFSLPSPDPTMDSLSP